MSEAESETKTEETPQSGISGAEETSTEDATRVASSENDESSSEPEGISGASPDEGDDADADGDTKDTDENEDANKTDPLDEVPDEYAFEVPEGFEPDEQLKKDWDESAKELGLTQRQYNGAIETFAKAVASNDDKSKQAQSEKVQGWKDALSKDDSLAPNKPGWVQVATARDAFAKEHPELGESLMADLKSTGLDHHPALARFFEWVGARVAEGRTTIDDKNPSSGGSVAARANKMFTKTPVNADA